MYDVKEYQTKRKGKYGDIDIIGCRLIQQRKMVYRGFQGFPSFRDCFYPNFTFSCLKLLFEIIICHRMYIGLLINDVGFII